MIPTIEVAWETRLKYIHEPDIWYVSLYIFTWETMIKEYSYIFLSMIYDMYLDIFLPGRPWSRYIDIHLQAWYMIILIYISTWDTMIKVYSHAFKGMKMDNLDIFLPGRPWSRWCPPATCWGKGSAPSWRSTCERLRRPSCWRTRQRCKKWLYQLC